MARFRVREDEPTQVTPTGAEIPLPRRGDVLGDLARAARRKAERDEDGSDARGPVDEG